MSAAWGASRLSRSAPRRHTSPATPMAVVCPALTSNHEVRGVVRVRLSELGVHLDGLRCDEGGISGAAAGARWRRLARAHLCGSSRDGVFAAVGEVTVAECLIEGGRDCSQNIEGSALD